MTLIIALGIVLNQAALASDLQRYAREWDARHLDIIAQRDRGQAAIEVAPISNMTGDYIGGANITSPYVQRCPDLYYGVDSITLKGS